MRAVDGQPISSRARSRGAAVAAPAPPLAAVALACVVLLTICLAATLLSALASPAAAGAATPVEAAGPATARSPFVAIGRQVGPAVVNIRVSRALSAGQVDPSPLEEMFRQFFPQPDDPGARRFDRTGTGSGFVVTAEGHILTNHHVVAGAEAIVVRFSGQRREHEAALLGSDPATDLALLKIEPEEPLAPLAFGDSDAIEVGDWAIAIGNPFGNLEGSLTVGVVSATGRGDLVIQGGTPRYQDFIQTDASINFGNSGGPLVDSGGRVIGVNTAVNTGGQGIGFAIPSNLARRVYEQLREHGRVRRGYLGARTEADDPAAAGAAAAGARVVAVDQDGPASRAGLREGDLIVGFAGRPVHEPRDLQFLVAEQSPGRAVECELRRDGERRLVQVVLGEADFGGPGAAGDPAAGWLGMAVASLTDPSPRVQDLKAALGVTAKEGVIVTEVTPGGPAAAAGIHPGDVLLAVDGLPLAGLDDYLRARAETSGSARSLQVLKRTGGEESIVLVKPGRAGTDQ